MDVIFVFLILPFTVWSSGTLLGFLVGRFFCGRVVFRYFWVIQPRVSETVPFPWSHWLGIKRSPLFQNIILSGIG